MSLIARNIDDKRDKARCKRHARHFRGRRNFPCSPDAERKP